MKNKGFVLLTLCAFLLFGALAPLFAESFQTVTLKGKTGWVGEPMSFDVKDLDIRDFFMLLAEIGHRNIIIDPAVKATITMKVHDVPWDQLLDIVCRMNGLGYEITGNVVSVND